MAKLSVYLTTGKPGEAIALCRLDNPPEALVLTIVQQVLDELFTEAMQLDKQKKTDLARIRLKNAWLLRSTLESLCPGLEIDERNFQAGKPFNKGRVQDEASP